MKHINKKIIFIGAGNVATHLALAFHKKGYIISQVYSRRISTASTLAKSLKCTYTDAISAIDTTADIYIIAVKDDAVSEIADTLRLKNKIVVHTSGSVPMDVLKPVSKNYGVFYPLQTFSKNKKVNFTNVPVCIESANASTLESLISLARSISDNVQKINSEQRKVIHLAAVFACNFSNHLYAIADNILIANELSLDILKPLIEETATKIMYNAPASVQTGPAIRKDKETINSHLQLLQGNKEYQRLYQLLSKSIIELDKQKKR